MAFDDRDPKFERALARHLRGGAAQAVVEHSEQQHGQARSDRLPHPPEIQLKCLAQERASLPPSYSRPHRRAFRSQSLPPRPTLHPPPAAA